MHRQPDWDKTHGCFTVSRLVKRFNAKVIAEIGVCLGHTATEVLNDNKIKQYYMIDHWENNDNYLKIVNNFYDCGLEIIKAKSWDALGMVPDYSLDLLYLDAGHTYPQTIRDLKTWYKKIKHGGVLVGDGFNHPKHPKYGVKRAVLQIFKPEEVNRNLGSDSNYWIYKP